MVSTLDLWLPVLVSAVAVFIASSVIHMVLTYHRNDFRGVPSEDEVMEALRRFNIPPGEYVLPHCDNPKQMEEPAFKEKMEKGPVAFLTVVTGGFNMGRSLVFWFLYCVSIGMFSAYLASQALDPDSRYLAIFRYVGTVSFGAYALALLQNSIWYKREWKTTLKLMLDGFIYASLTAGIFGWLWPG